MYADTPDITFTNVIIPAGRLCYDPANNKSKIASTLDDTIINRLLEILSTEDYKVRESRKSLGNVPDNISWASLWRISSTAISRNQQVSFSSNLLSPCSIDSKNIKDGTDQIHCYFSDIEKVTGTFSCVCDITFCNITVDGSFIISSRGHQSQNIGTRMDNISNLVLTNTDNKIKLI